MNEKQNKNFHGERESKLSVADIFKILREGIVWLVIITVLFASLGIVYAVGYKKTTYTATVDAYLFTDTVYVEETNSSEKLQEYMAFQYCAMLVPQISKVLTSNEVMTEANKAGIYLKGSLSFSVVEESPYFSITYTYKEHGGDPEAIKKEVAKTLNDYVAKSIETIDSGDVQAGYLKDKINVYSNADWKDVSSSTGRVKTVILVTFVGFVVAVLFVLVKRLLSDTIMTREQIESITNNQVIATVDISAIDQRDKYAKRGSDNA